TQQLGKRIFYLSGETRVPLIRYAYLAKTQPGTQSSEETISFRHRVQGIHYSAIQQTEISRVQRYLDRRKARQYPVENEIGTAPENVFFAFGSHTIDDLIPLPPLLKQL